MKVAPVVFSIPTATGNFNVSSTGVGASGDIKGAICLAGAGATNDTAAVGANLSVGLTDGANDRGVCVGTEDAVASPNAKRFPTVNMMRILTAAAGGTDGNFTQVSWITDGGTFNRTTALDGAWLSTMLFLVGADAQIAVGDIATNATQNSTATVSGLAFQPTEIIIIAQRNGSFTAATILADADISVGIAWNDAGTARNFCGARWEDDGVATTASSSVTRDNRCATAVNGGASTAAAEVTSYTSDGFVITTRDFSVAMQLGYIAIKRNSLQKFWAGIVNSPTAGLTTDYTAFGFTPHFVGTIMTRCATANTVETDADAGVMAIGMCAGSGKESSYSIASEDAAATSNTQNIPSDDFCRITSHTGGAGTVLNFNSFLATGIRVTNTTLTDGTTRRWVMFGWGNERISGTAAGVGTGSGTLKGKGRLRGTAAGVGSGSGTIKGKGRLIGTAAGIGSGSGTIKGRGRLIGTSVGVGSGSGTIKGKGRLIGTAVGVGSGSGTMRGRGRLIGTSAGVGSGSGTLKARGALTGTSSGVATGSGALHNATPLSGQITGTSAGVGSGSGTLRGKGRMVGTSAGVGSGSGTLGGRTSMVGTSAGVATGAGTLRGRGRLVGTAAGVATGAGTMRATGRMVGAAAGVGSAIGTLAGRGRMVGTASGVASGTGTLAGRGRMVGTSSGVATGTGTMRATGRMVGAAAGVGSSSGTLKGRGRIVGTSAGVGSSSGTLKGRGRLVGTATGVATGTGTLRNATGGSGAITGTSAGVGSSSGTLRGIGRLQGTASGIASASGTMRARGKLTGTSQGVASGAGEVTGSGRLVGTSGGAASGTGTLGARHRMVGTAAGVASGSGTLTPRFFLVGTAAGVATGSGTLAGRGKLQGTSAGVATVFGTLHSFAVLGPWARLMKIVRTRVHREIGLAFTVPILWDNEPEGTADYQLWISAQVIGASHEQIDDGASTNRYRKSGWIDIAIHSKLGHGEKDALELSDRVRIACLEVSEFLAGDELRFRQPLLLTRGRERHRFVIRMRCPFYADFALGEAAA